MKVYIDPGHGGSDPGASFGPLVEKTICLLVALELALRLIRKGHETMLSRSGDFRIGLSKRAIAANQWAADIFISLHTNADADPDEPGLQEAKGSEIWIYPGSRGARRLAECIRDEIPTFFPGRRFRGIKQSSFTVLSVTEMPAVLIELAFIDTGESSRLTGPEIQRKIADCIFKGIESYLA